MEYPTYLWPFICKDWRESLHSRHRPTIFLLPPPILLCNQRFNIHHLLIPVQITKKSSTHSLFPLSQYWHLSTISEALPIFSSFYQRWVSPSVLPGLALFLGSGPDRGRSPVWRGKFLYVCLFVLPPFGPSSQAWGPASQASGLRPQAWLDGPEGGMDGQTDKRMNGKSPHSTGLCPLLGLLPCPPHKN